MHFIDFTSLQKFKLNFLETSSLSIAFGTLSVMVAYVSIPTVFRNNLHGRSIELTEQDYFFTAAAPFRQPPPPPQFQTSSALI